MKQKHQILGVYHLACMNHYMNTFCEQFELLHSSGLYQASNKLLIYISMNDNNTMLNAKLKEYDPKNKFKIFRSKDNLKEKFAINNFRDHIKDEDYIFYFHSKGVSHPVDSNLQHWRKVLDFYTLSKWKINVELIKKYDAVGCFLARWPEHHFCGNFWWSRVDYIKKLPDCDDHYIAPEMFLAPGFNNNFVSLSNDRRNMYHTDGHLTRTNEDILKNVTRSIINNEQFTNTEYYIKYYGSK
jgi:hypothetical protein